MKVTALTALTLILSVSSVFADALHIPEAEEVYPIVPNWQKARILHIGDSHLSFGFKREMARHFREAGAKFLQKRWKGSRTKSWITSGRAKHLIDVFRPTVVVVTLGTNEMKDDKPERNGSWVRALIDRIGNRICYWLGPPPLLEDKNGYNDFMAGHVAPCRYFDSRSLSLPLRDDGRFHLTRQQGETWAELVWRWMNGR
jgi:hypothetical protein